jgi:lactobin A/cerein 7B family class IIb bacteriocin
MKELNEKELKDVNGGGIVLGIVIYFVVTEVLLEAALNLEAHKKAFNEGRELAKK